MIESIITDYLQTNRRLVIPGLGAFLRKEGGELVFVPFLNKDDGVLTGLVRKTYGSSSAEAESVIEQYTETIRRAMEEQGRYLIAPLGALKKDLNGIIYLDGTDQAAEPSRPLIVPVAPAAKPEMVVEEEVIAIVPVVKEEEKQAATKEVAPPMTLYDRLMEQQQRQEAARPVQASAPAPKKRVERPREVPRVEKPAVSKPVEAKPSHTPPPGSGPDVKKAKRGDFILVFAIIVAVLAVAAMVYAYVSVELPAFNLN